MFLPIVPAAALPDGPNRPTASGFDQARLLPVDRPLRVPAEGWGVAPPSRSLLFGRQTIECRLRFAGHAPDDLACRQNLADVARALSGRQASLLDVALEIARRQDGAIARHRNRLAVEDG